MTRFILLSGLVCSLGGCAGRLDAQADACTLAVLQPADIAAVEPLWVQNRTMKSPSYTLGGVIVALRDDHPATRARAEAQVASRATACGTPDVQTTLGATDGHLEVVLRSDDPATAQAVLAGAERRMKAQ